MYYLQFIYIIDQYYIISNFKFKYHVLNDSYFDDVNSKVIYHYELI